MMYIDAISLRTFFQPKHGSSRHKVRLLVIFGTVSRGQHTGSFDRDSSRCVLHCIPIMQQVSLSTKSIDPRYEISPDISRFTFLVHGSPFSPLNRLLLIRCTKYWSKGCSKKHNIPGLSSSYAAQQPVSCRTNIHVIPWGVPTT
ncbi:hypothetical protein BDN67DRAFT_689120 [Paxillus ammoniavirescens]|nr:hypothetical protein BDN67DRAFT_689120 [Paxillus ammoniavirescens]